MDRPSAAANDWLVDAHGYFVLPATLTLPDTSVVSAAVFVANRISEIHSVQAVYLRGSALNASSDLALFDVDLVVATLPEEVEHCRDSEQIGEPLTKACGRYWKEAASDFGELPPLDLCVIEKQCLVHEAGAEMTRLLTWLQGIRLVGADIFADLPPVEASAATGHRLLKIHCRATTNGKRWYAKRGHAVPSEWLQKRVLRLGGILSLIAGRPFSRHPQRCAELISGIQPDLSYLAEQVAHDLFSRNIAPEVDERAEGLWDQLLARHNSMAVNEVRQA